MNKFTKESGKVLVDIVKNIAVVLLGFIAVLMVGCKSKDLGDNYIKGKDAQYMFMIDDINRYMVSGESGYYFINGIYLYYCDYDNMESMVLCSKPNCLHDKELDETKKYNCNGFIDAGIYPKLLTIYDNNIYCYIEEDFLKEHAKPELIRISLDGNERKTICELENNIISMSLHRGKLYYSTKTIINQENDTTKVTLKEINISSGKSKDIFSIEGIDASIINIIPKGNYIIYDKYFVDTNYNAIWENYMYSFTDGSQIKIGADVTDDELGKKSISGNSVLFIPRKVENDEVYLDGNVYSFDLKSKESAVLFKREFEDIIFYSDDKYIYVDNILEILKEDKEDFKRTLTIYDKSGSKVDTIDVNEIKDFIYFVSGDDKNIVIKLENEKGAYIKYIDKSKIGTGSAKLETLFELERKYLDTTISK